MKPTTQTMQQGTFALALFLLLLVVGCGKKEFKDNAEAKTGTSVVAADGPTMKNATPEQRAKMQALDSNPNMPAEAKAMEMNRIQRGQGR